MARGRYDKYDFMAGGFRGVLAADWPAADIDRIVGVGADADGLIVQGAGVTGLLGVAILTSNKPTDGTRGPARRAGDTVDPMTDGELVECVLDDGTAMTPGTIWGVDPVTGEVAAGVGERFAVSLENSNTAGTRLIVRFTPGTTALVAV